MAHFPSSAPPRGITSGRPLRAALAIAALGYASSVCAADGRVLGFERARIESPFRIYLQVGRNPETDTYGGGVLWDTGWRRDLGAAGSVHVLLDGSVSRWHSELGPRRGTGSSRVTQFGITPVLRWHPFSRAAGWFAEAGIGANAITPLYTSSERRFTTVFQFGDHVGIGWDSAGRHPFEVSLRYQHVSNGGIKEPNSGANFVQLRLAYGF